MSDKWYYRTLGQEVGPVSENTLRQLIGSGMLGRDDFVCEDRRSWIKVGELPFVDDLATRVAEGSPSAHGTKQPLGTASSKDVRSAIAESQRYLHQRDAKLASQSQIRRPRRMGVGLAEWERVFRLPGAVLNALIAITGHMIGWLMGVAGPVVRSKLTWGGLLVLVTSCLAFAIPAKILTQTETHAFLTRTVTEFRRLRADNADEKQWQAFSQRTHDELGEIVPKLEQAARTDDPVSMEFLFLARDFLPLMLADAREQPSDAERKFDVHMDRVERVFAVESTWTDWIPDWPLVGIVLLNGFLVIAGVCWWRWSS